MLEGHPSRMLVIANKKIERVSVLPVLFDRDEKPARVLKANEAGFGQVADYIKEITHEVGVQTEFRVEGDELVIQQ